MASQIGFSGSLLLLAILSSSLSILATEKTGKSIETPSFYPQNPQKLITPREATAQGYDTGVANEYGSPSSSYGGPSSSYGSPGGPGSNYGPPGSNYGAPIHGGNEISGGYQGGGYSGGSGGYSGVGGGYSGVAGGYQGYSGGGIGESHAFHYKLFPSGQPGQSYGQPGVSYGQPSTSYGMGWSGSTSNNEDDDDDDPTSGILGSFGGGNGGGGGGGGAAGIIGPIAAVLKAKAIKKGVGLVKLIKLGVVLVPIILPLLIPLILPIIIIGLIILAPILLLIPIPAIVYRPPVRRSMSSAYPSLSSFYSSTARVARDVLTAEECIERVSCELSRGARSVKIQPWVSMLMDKVPTYLKEVKWIERASKVLKAGHPKCQKFTCNPGKTLKTLFKME